MLKISQVLIFTFFSLLFYSCEGQLSEKEACAKKFKAARDLAYADPTRQSALDSAMSLASECMRCDSIRKAVVDFKITLFIATKKYDEGIKFIDSLRESDFTYAYKKNILSKNLQALGYNYKNDTAQRNITYREMANDIEQYIKRQDIKDKEFREAYTDLFTVKENYLDANQINIEVETLKKIYPEKKDFFDFFKK